MALAGGNHKILRGVQLQHHPHGLDIIRSIPPVPFSVQVAKIEFVLQAEFDAGHRPGYFSGYKSFTASWRFMVE